MVSLRVFLSKDLEYWRVASTEIRVLEADRKSGKLLEMRKNLRNWDLSIPEKVCLGW